MPCRRRYASPRLRHIDAIISPYADAAIAMLLAACRRDLITLRYADAYATRFRCHYAAAYAVCRVLWKK